VLISTRAKKIIARGKVAGKSAKLIAAESGVSEGKIQHHRNDAEIVAYIEQFAGACRVRLDKAFSNAVDSLVKDTCHRDPEVRSQARADLVDILVKIDRARGCIGGGRGAVAGSGSGEYELMHLQAAWVRLGEAAE